MRKLIVVVCAATAAALSACGQSASEGGPASSTTPSASVTTQQITALAELVFPKSSEQPAYGVCGADLNFSACPYTDRLKARLTQQRETLLRSRNLSTTREITGEVTSADAGIAHVKLFQGRRAMDLYVVRQGNASLVDDEICAGRKDTSIYATFVTCDSSAQ
jgi:hypothetical protein